ncbi:guanine nucleotide exchange factor [Pelomyxa schiedti]|nr:guanine nucleotide exchange factor [Pelomyxa schiedti]
MDNPTKEAPSATPSTSPAPRPTRLPAHLAPPRHRLPGAPPPSSYSTGALLTASQRESLRPAHSHSHNHSQHQHAQEPTSSQQYAHSHHYRASRVPRGDDAGGGEYEQRHHACCCCPHHAHRHSRHRHGGIPPSASEFALDQDPGASLGSSKRYHSSSYLSSLCSSRDEPSREHHRRRRPSPAARRSTSHHTAHGHSHGSHSRSTTRSGSSSHGHTHSAAAAHARDSSSSASASASAAATATATTSTTTGGTDTTPPSSPCTRPASEPASPCSSPGTTPPPSPPSLATTPPVVLDSAAKILDPEREQGHDQDQDQEQDQELNGGEEEEEGGAAASSSESSESSESESDDDGSSSSSSSSSSSDSESEDEVALTVPDVDEENSGSTTTTTTTTNADTTEAETATATTNASASAGTDVDTSTNENSSTDANGNADAVVVASQSQCIESSSTSLSPATGIDSSPAAPPCDSTNSGTSAASSAASASVSSAPTPVEVAKPKHVWAWGVDAVSNWSLAVKSDVGHSALYSVVMDTLLPDSLPFDSISDSLTKHNIDGVALAALATRMSYDIFYREVVNYVVESIPTSPEQTSSTSTAVTSTKISWSYKNFEEISQAKQVVMLGKLFELNIPHAALLAASLLRLKAACVFQRAWHRRIARKQRTLHEYRGFCAREILSSEECYVEELQILVDTVMEPLRASKIISEDDIKSIFSDVAIIRSVNESLLATLRSRIAKWNKTQKLGDVFLRMSDYLRVYTEYVKNFYVARNTLKKYDGSHAFWNFYRKQQQLFPVKHQERELDCYLILPIQRIPRYRLLLQDLLRHTPKDHVDYEDLSKAVVKIAGLADWVNQSQHKYERQQKIIDFQSSIGGLADINLQLVTASREFIKEGELVEMTGRKTIKRYIILFNDLIVICSYDTSSFFKKFKYQLYVALSMKDATVTEVTGQTIPLGFNLATRRHSLILCANTEQDKEKWFSELTTAITKFQEQQKSLDEKTTGIARVKAEQASAILEQQYANLRVKTLLDGGRTLSTPQFKRETIYSMSPAEKWALAEEAKVELDKLKRESRLFEAALLENAEINKMRLAEALSNIQTGELVRTRSNLEKIRAQEYAFNSSPISPSTKHSRRYTINLSLGNSSGGHTPSYTASAHTSLIANAALSHRRNSTASWLMDLLSLNRKPEEPPPPQQQTTTTGTTAEAPLKTSASEEVPQSTTPTFSDS